jgi:CMP-N,N'-diacetyllegionaminic acid synthase
MKVLGVITARGGSKRLPNKNVAMLGGKPLIAWSIEVGRATCDHVVTSTDSPLIADVARKYGSSLVMRPDDLSQDDTPSLPVVVHAAKQFEGEGYDVVLLLQPTSPFRDERDVVAAIKKMEDTDAESVVSMVLRDDYNSFCLGHADRIRQPAEAEDRWAMNGAIYLIRWYHLMGGGDWEGPRAYAYKMPPERSLDIDTHADFDAAVAMLDERGRLKGPA